MARGVDSAQSLIERVRAGHVPSIARMISRIESGADGVVEQVAELYRLGGDARIVGITGPPGAGRARC